MGQDVRDLVHCEVHVYAPGTVIEETDKLEMQILAHETDGKWQYFEDIQGCMRDYNEKQFITDRRAMLITLTPLPNDNPARPYRSYIEMEIAEAGDVDEFFGSFCDDIVAIAARRLQDNQFGRHYCVFTLLCEGMYARYYSEYGKDASFELYTVRELDYEKLELAAIENPETEDVPLPPELSEHTRFILESESGHIGFVHGDPNMSEETKAALRDLIDAAYKAVENGEIEPDEDES